MTLNRLSPEQQARFDWAEVRDRIDRGLTALDILIGKVEDEAHRARLRGKKAGLLATLAEWKRLDAEDLPSASTLHWNLSVAKETAPDEQRSGYDLGMHYSRI